MKWPFSQPKTQLTLTTAAIMAGNDWIQWVFHDGSDGTWQFQGERTDEEPLAAALLSMFQLEPRLAELADLEAGSTATRETREGEWIRVSPPLYELANALERHQEHPSTFHLPPQRERTTLRKGDLAKLIFQIHVAGDVVSERMWVRVKRAYKTSYLGTLANNADSTPELKFGDAVKFGPDHIIEIRRGE